MKKLPSNQSGQALLIIVLVMFVGLTISLSLLFRTTTDIKLSRQFEESSRAFSAAEAGIEEGLRDLTVSSGSEEIETNISYNFISQEASQGSGPFSLGKLEKQNAGTVWLAKQDESSPYSGSEILLCWKQADGSTPSIEAIILYKNSSNEYKVARGFYQPAGIVDGSGECGDPDDSVYSQKVNISLPSGGETLLVLRLKPVGDDAFVVVDPPGSNSLPSQGNEVISTGKVGDTVRKIKVVKSYPSWPEIFDYVLFSGGNLVKE